jgi:hypothetical protein
MSNETLAEFIDRRRKELTAQRGSLLEQLAAIDNELKQLNAAEEAAKSSQFFIGLAGRMQMAGSTSALLSQLPVRAPRGAIKKAVIRTLAQHPDGLDAMSILHEMNARDATDYERTSLSPQLSRLKNDGILTLDGNIWRLAGGVAGLEDLLTPMDEDEPSETEGQ